MLKGKRSSKRNESIDDDLTGCSKVNKRPYLTRSATKNKATMCNGGDPESNRDVWSELNEEVASDLSKTVVSLALSNGHEVLFTCTGIAVQREGCVTRFLTSASLAEALIDKRKYHDNLKIEVRHGDNVVRGFLEEYDADDNMAAVNVKNFPDLQTVAFRKLMEFPPHVNVVAVGRAISGELITSSGILNWDVCEGGPLFDSDGNFIGTNVSFSKEGRSFIPKVILLDKMCLCYPFLDMIEFPEEVRAEECSNVEMLSSHQEVLQDMLNEYQSGNLESLGYPEPPTSMLNDGIILANNFEDPFGDIYSRGVWSEVSETVASTIRDNIVGLASFNGEERFFACSGCLISWNGGSTILTAASLIRDSYDNRKIVENLRMIEVLLPNKKLAEGILQHYSLHYNIALVSVNDFSTLQPVEIQHVWRDNRDLIAVGCVFKSQKLMAARGEPFCTVVTHDCKFLGYTRCGITKAGIGGPLFDFDGKFVGMNFYDKYAGGGGTPYLSWDAILLVLDHFKTKKTVADVGHDGYASRGLDLTFPGDRSVRLNSWPVPLPFWTTPDDLKRYDFAMRMRRPQFVSDLSFSSAVKPGPFPYYLPSP